MEESDLNGFETAKIVPTSKGTRPNLVSMHKHMSCYEMLLKLL